MASYQDKTGFTWVINLDVKILKAIRRRVTTKDGTSFDILNVADGRTIQNLVSDPILLVDTLWVVEEDQAKRAGKTQDQFTSVHVGDTLLEAAAALAEALADFFPSLEGMAVREAILSLQRQRKLALEKIRENLRKEEAKLEPKESGS